MSQPNHSQFLWQNFEFRVGAIDGLQICSLKPSELGTISFTSCVFLCYGKQPENGNQTEWLENLTTCEMLVLNCSIFHQFIWLRTQVLLAVKK